MSEHITTQDPPLHTRTRGLLNKLITPKRLKENEDFMWRLADNQLDKFIGRGECEFLEDYAKPFSLLVIADLLGVPAEDHDEFRAVFASEQVGASAKSHPPRTMHCNGSTTSSTATSRTAGARPVKMC